jgi:Protein of unknown function (DUF2934)
MWRETAEKHLRTGEKLNIVAMDANEQGKRMRAAIARRAYEIFKDRGGTPCHEIDDWRQAESEVIRQYCFGRMNLGEMLWVSTDAAPFAEGTINIWVAPRRLTISGKPSSQTQALSNANQDAQLVFRAIDLPVAIDPSRVSASVKASSLEILLRKAQANAESKLKRAAA